MNTKDNLLELLSDMYASAVEYREFINYNASEDELKTMIEDITNKIIYLNEFIFDNIDLDKIEE
jgi:hypothetical protein